RRVRIGGLLELPDALQQLARLGFEPLPVAPELVELRGLALELALRLLGFVRVATQRLDQVLPTLELGRQPLELELSGIQLPPQLGCGLAFRAKRFDQLVLSTDPVGELGDAVLALHRRLLGGLELAARLLEL